MINHSLDYIKKRIKDDTCINMPIEEFQNMNIMPFLSCYDKDYYPLTKSNVTNKINADLRYSPFANFNYFITETCICDGTLLFITELIQRIIHKIKIIQTCHQPTMELFLKNGEMPKDFANKNVIHYEVNYEEICH